MLIPCKISIFGTEIVHIDLSTAFIMIMIINGVGIPGRILPAYIVPHVGGVLNVLIVVAFFAGLLLFLWSQVRNLNGLIAFTVVYGFFANAVQSLVVGGVGSLTKDKQKMGTRIGMIFTLISVACLSGPPIAGALISLRGGDFLYAQIFGGVVMCMGSFAYVTASVWNRMNSTQT